MTWEEVLQKLEDWLNETNKDADHNLTRECIEMAFKVAKRLLLQEEPSPSNISMDGDGGLSFEFRNGSTLTTIDFNDDGSKQRYFYQDNEMTVGGVWLSEDDELAKPWIHSKSSARRFGGKPEDYLEIHQLMDSSKSSFSDNRHRIVTHNSWFIGAGGILERIFGVVITNSDGREVSVRDIGEQHILEDFGMRFIPNISDYLEHMEYKSWMTDGRGEPPSSHKKIDSQKKIKVVNTD